MINWSQLVSLVGRNITDDEVIGILPIMDDVPSLEKDEFSDNDGGYLSFYKKGICCVLQGIEIKSVIVFLEPDEDFSKYSGPIFNCDGVDYMTANFLFKNFGEPVRKSKEGGVNFLGKKIFWVKYLINNIFYHFEYNERCKVNKITISVD